MKRACYLDRYLPYLRTVSHRQRQVFFFYLNWGASSSVLCRSPNHMLYHTITFMEPLYYLINCQNHIKSYYGSSLFSRFESRSWGCAHAVQAKLTANYVNRSRTALWIVWRFFSLKYTILDYLAVEEVLWSKAVINERGKITLKENTTKGKAKFNYVYI